MSLEFLNTRRSVRRFTDEQVDPKDLKEILNTAFLAPSSKNGQPWHFITVTDAEKRKYIAERHPYMHMAEFAPMVIVVCVDPEITPLGACYSDASAATMNILYAAKALGYGACWCGVYPQDERMQIFRDCLNIPENMVVYSAIPIGRPAKENPPTPERYNEERIHTEKW